MNGARIRLFDGERFAADQHVPDALLTEDRHAGLTTRVTDVAEVGSQVWASLEDVSLPFDDPVEGREGRVVGWSDGVGTGVSGRDDGVSGLRAAAGDGTVWATGLVGLGEEAAVKRWDGSTWISAGPKFGALVLPVEVVAGRSGEAWFLCAQCVPVDGEYDTVGLVRFDGGTWQPVSGDLVNDIVWEPGYGNLGGIDGGRAGWLTVAPDGAAWVAGPEVVARVAPDGSVQEYGAKQGLRHTIRGIAAASDQIVVLDARGVLRLDHGVFTRVWEDPVADAPNGDGSRTHLLAASAHEAWAVEFAELPKDAWRRSLSRYADGAWRVVGPDSGGTEVCPPVLATDGAVWTTTSAGLIRFCGDDHRVVADEVTACPEGAGPRGSVWLMGATRFGWHPEYPGGIDDVAVLYRADGSPVSIGRPTGWDTVCFLASGADGSLWVRRRAVLGDPGYRCPEWAGEVEYETADALARWDGTRWTEVPAPPGMVGIAVSEPTTWAASAYQGASGWATGEQTWIDWHRFEDGEWAKVSQDSGSPPVEAVHFTELRQPVLPAPGGGACAQAFGTLACIEPSGEVARLDVVGTGVETGVREFSIAPDGSVWALGPQVARVARTVAAS